MIDIYFTEIIRNYQFHAEKLAEAIKEKEMVFNEYDFANLQNNISCMNATIKHISEVNQIYISNEFVFDSQNKSVLELIKWHKLNSFFDKENARKSFINGLVLILLDDYTFNGVFFDKKSVKINIKNILNKKEK